MMTREKFEEIERIYVPAEGPVVNRGDALGGPSFGGAVEAVRDLVQEVKRLNPDFQREEDTECERP